MDSAEFVRRSRRLAEQQAATFARRAAVAHLQAGEDPATPYLEDAEHWIGVYEELAAFKRQLIDQIDRQSADANHRESEQEIDRERRAAGLELDRILLHLEFWRHRSGELRGGDEPGR